MVEHTLSRTAGLTRKQIRNQPKVQSFLNVMGQSSLKTRKNYETGLVHFQEFLNHMFAGAYSLETVIEGIGKKEIDPYTLIDNFVSFESTNTRTVRGKEMKVLPQTIRAMLIGIKSYLAYYDIDFIPSKFKRKVKIPKVHKEDEEPLDSSDIRRILLACNNRRLKAYLLVLASGGMRAAEGLAIRLKDIDFTTSPTRVHIRKEYSKTRVARDIYISDEATHYLKQWVEWKYRTKRYNPRIQAPDDLAFTLAKNTESPIHDSLYGIILKEFQNLLDTAGLDERKESMRRRKITLHSLRRFVKTVISDQTNQDYSEWFLGHSKSPYYTKKEPERREIYATKCMKYLTFLDYTALQATGRNIEAKLEAKDREMETLRIGFDMIQAQMHALVTCIGGMDQTSRNSFAKLLFEQGIYRKA
jgi:integrase